MTVYIIIPVHNRLEDTIACIDSLEKQTYENIKIIVVDDGSTDDTGDYLKRKDNVITIQGDGNLWWSGAIQKGIEYVLGAASDADYILFVNNDIVFDEHYMETIVQDSKDNDNAVVGSILIDREDRKTVHDLGPVLDIWRMLVFQRYSLLNDDEKQNLNKHYCSDALSGRGTLYPVPVVKKTGAIATFFLPHYGADYEYSWRAGYKGANLIVSTQAKVYSYDDFGGDCRKGTWLERKLDIKSIDHWKKVIFMYALIGTPLQRITVWPRMFILWLNRRFRPIYIYNAIKYKVVNIFKTSSLTENLYKYWKIYNIKRNIKQSEKKRIVVGSSGVFEDDWIPTDVDILDITDLKKWKSLFGTNKLDAILAEHVWEHLTLDEALISAKNCLYSLRKGGYLRIAVPDGNHPDDEYIIYVDVNGTGPGSDDHKVLYTADSLKEVLVEAGFEVNCLEYFDEDGKFHYKDWSENDGMIHRSSRFDERNTNGELNYTSIIIDAVKP